MIFLNATRRFLNNDHEVSHHNFWADAIFARWIALICFAWSAQGAHCSSSTNTEGRDTSRVSASAQQSESDAAQPIFINEYRVEGAQSLPRLEVEEAVYPYLGPGRTPADVEQARAALEKAYKERGYQATSVQIPPQQVKNGVVVLQVMEGRVGRLRVKGASYFSPGKIKAMAPSMADGKVINFNEVTRDIVALNQLADRRVTPSLRPGIEPGTIDVDLEVKDELPLHGSLELNNRYSPDTEPLRLNGGLSYDNLWQLGHSIGMNFQIAPQALNQVKVFSGYYLALVPNVSWLSLMLQGMKQDSNVSTLGAIDSAGRGEVIGIRALASLEPEMNLFHSEANLFHSLSFGIDYKNFRQAVTMAGVETQTPVSYYPIGIAYCATLTGKGAVSQLNAGLNFHLCGGSTSQTFDDSRYSADRNFIYFRGDLSHTHDLAGDIQIFGKVQGQSANQPLVNNEQFSGGGLSTVRGYLESEVLGDSALCGSLELRTPSFGSWISPKIEEWRCYVFGDAGKLTIREPLPEQTSQFNLASYGIGSRIRIFDHFNGSLDIGIPLVSQEKTKKQEPLFTFRLWAEF